MSNDDHELKGAVDRWQKDGNKERISKQQLVEALTLALEYYNITQLSEMTGIKRTTLYYMIYGKTGKGGRQDQNAA